MNKFDEREKTFEKKFQIDQELKLSQQQELDNRKKLMNESMGILNDRERKILVARKLSRHSYNYREDNLLDAVAYLGGLDNYIKEKKNG